MAKKLHVQPCTFFHGCEKSCEGWSGHLLTEKSVFKAVRGGLATRLTLSCSQSLRLTTSAAVLLSYQALI